MHRCWQNFVGKDGNLDNLDELLQKDKGRKHLSALMRAVGFMRNREGTTKDWGEDNIVRMEQKTKAFLEQITKFVTDKSFKNLTESLKECQLWAGGLPEAADWRAGLAPDADWPTVSRIGNSTLVAKGKPQVLESAITKLTQAALP